jgi:hypothetical protein
MIKKSHLRQLSFILTMSVSLLSCTIQKRSFNRGYHVEWKTTFNKNESIIVYLDTNNQILSKENCTILSSGKGKSIDQLNKSNNSTLNLLNDRKEPIKKGLNFILKDTIKKKEFTYKNKNYIGLKNEVDKLDDLKYDKKEHFWIGIILLALSSLLLFLSYSHSLLFILIAGIALGSIGLVISIIFLIISLILAIKYQRYAEKLISKNS